MGRVVGVSMHDSSNTAFLGAKGLRKGLSPDACAVRFSVFGTARLPHPSRTRARDVMSLRGAPA
eukprot:7255565-Prymnesium_polylepis.1